MKTPSIGQSFTIACVIAGTLWISCTGIECAQQIDITREYELLCRGNQNVSLAESVKDENTYWSPNWENLLATNGDCVGWLAVEGTSISYPIVQASEGEPSFYLTHDFWGNRSAYGCPYIDNRTSLGHMHTLVYGHHISSSNQMFSELAKAYQPNTFKALGRAFILTPDHDVLSFEPICALRVDQANGDIQTFSWSTEDDMASWLQNLTHQAGKTTSGADIQKMSPKQVLTLVTCSGDMAGQRERTLVIYAR